MNKQKLIGEMNKQEFLELVNSITTISLRIGEVEVSSQKNTLKQLEDSINRLIHKHKDYLMFVKDSKLKAGGYFG